MNRIFIVSYYKKGSVMFFKFLLFLKRTFIGRYFLNTRVATIQYGLAKGMKRRGGIGILAFFLKKQNKEEIFFKSMDFSNKTVYDIGANFGEFTLFLAKATAPNGHVISFDPIQQNCDAIADNLSLNNLHNVNIIQKGVGSHKESRTFMVDPDATQQASFNEEIKKSIQGKSHVLEIMFEIDSLDSIIADQKLPVPDFVKIDVEGFELEVLQGMTNTLHKIKPQLFIENHGSNDSQKKENIANIVNILTSFGYKINHIETEVIIEPENSFIAFSGHIYCK
jgi:FkbM family methyltransferase